MVRVSSAKAEGLKVRRKISREREGGKIS